MIVSDRKTYMQQLSLNTRAYFDCINIACAWTARHRLPFSDVSIVPAPYIIIAQWQTTLYNALSFIAISFARAPCFALCEWRCILYTTLPLIFDLHALAPHSQPVIESTEPNTYITCCVYCTYCIYPDVLTFWVLLLNGCIDLWVDAGRYVCW